ncbi:MAG: class I SAM-dependent methyltransferase [Propionibacteriaceae bacterium]|jgi:SAM-dependent methyltransferase|nr:class I SAM-dependent methyltransferase [Propionibacteriaceae bacterium]
MASSQRLVFPSAAIDWLAERCPASLPVLTLASSATLARKLAARGFPVIHAATDAATAIRAQGTKGVTPIVAHPEALPIASCTLGAVIAHQSLHRAAPGLALPEIARVLKPDGWFCVSHFERDDSIPWVRKLIDLMRSFDPQAMSNADARTIEAWTSSKYYPSGETKSFRVWVPISQAQMLEMVAGQSAVAALPDAQREKALDDARHIYSSAASGAELRLPYQLKCWRAQVDQSELTTPVRISDDGLVISL